MTTLFYSVFPTALGYVAVARGPQGVRRVILPVLAAGMAYRDLIDACTDASLVKDPAPLHPSVIQIQEYFRGERTVLDFEVDLSGVSSFDRRVYEAARSIPYGEVRSYGWVAQESRNPKAARAVGQAMGRNPVPPYIPCHRVIRSDGSLGGFGSGLLLKSRMLSLEKSPLGMRGLGGGLDGGVV